MHSGGRVIWDKSENEWQLVLMGPWDHITRVVTKPQYSFKAENTKGIKD